MRSILKSKKLLSTLLCVLIIVQNIPVFAIATEYDNEQAVLEPITMQAAPDLDFPSNEELFTVYAEQVLYGYEIATFGNAAGDQLTGDEKLAYDALKPVVGQIAAGKRAATAVSLGYGSYRVRVNGEIQIWTPEVTVNFTEAAVDFDLKAVMTALVSDCPFEMYWYDKIVGCETSYLQINGGTLCYIEFRFNVADAYSKGSFMADTAKTAAAATATANANAVVQANKHKTPYERLVAYKEYICTATSYNNAAAEDNSTPYGDPWQLIYVFDNDNTTNVVCEGYAKAFQYLCDLDAMLEQGDKDDILCVCASGIMAGGTSKGRHMWNVVTIGGKNYLVDVTNCDENTVGAPDRLFMVGSTYISDHYSFVCGNQTVYYYCEDLCLAGEKYTVPETPAICSCEAKCSQDSVNGECAVCSEDFGSCTGEGDVQIEIVVLSDDVSYTTYDQMITVEYGKPCRVGYWDEESQKYNAITAIENDDSYSFTIPDEATKVLIGIKGNANGDERVTVSDIAAMNANILGKMRLTAETVFAADANGDGSLDDADILTLSSAILGKRSLAWEVAKTGN